MKAGIVICFIAIIGLIVGVNLMNRTDRTPTAVEKTETADVPH